MPLMFVIDGPDFDSGIALSVMSETEKRDLFVSLFGVQNKSRYSGDWRDVFAFEGLFFVDILLRDYAFFTLFFYLAFNFVFILHF